MFVPLSCLYYFLCLHFSLFLSMHFIFFLLFVFVSLFLNNLICILISHYFDLSFYLSLLYIFSNSTQTHFLSSPKYTKYFPFLVFLFAPRVILLSFLLTFSFLSRFSSPLHTLSFFPCLFTFLPIFHTFHLFLPVLTSHFLTISLSSSFPCLSHLPTYASLEHKFALQFSHSGKLSVLP